MKRFLACALLLIILLPFCAFASSARDLGNITVEYCHDGVPIKGASVNLYRVASFSDDGGYSPEEAFSFYGIDYKNIGENSRASDAVLLRSFVIADKIKPSVTVTTDQNGRAVFEDQKTGLYLMTCEKIAQDGYFYTMTPALISVPSLDGNGAGVTYDIEVFPKSLSEKKPDVTPDDKKDLEVIITWDDEGEEDKRPDEVRVELLRDGEIYDRVKISKKMKWRHKWKGLDEYNDDGSKVEWTVIERLTSDHIITIEIEKDTIIINNRLSEDIPGGDEPIIPQTGQLWWPVPALAALGLLMIIFGVAAKKKDEK